MAFSTFASLTPLIDYLRPAKSPYLLMVLCGAVATVATSQNFDLGEKWARLIVPQFAALIVFTVFAYVGRDEHTLEEQEDQLRFSRAVSIAAALLCLAFGSYAIDDREFPVDWPFEVNFWACVLQLVVFASYSATRLFKEDKASNFNFFQFSFITSAYLVAATYCLTKLDFDEHGGAALPDSSLVEQAVVVTAEPEFLATAVVLYVLWTVCQLFWVRRLFGLVRITVVDE